MSTIERATDTTTLLRTRIGAAMDLVVLQPQLDVPLLGHLLGVGSLVFEHGGDPDQVIAALLHHTIHAIGTDEVRAAFGDTVADVAAACRTNPTADVVEHLPSPALLVCLADQVHQVRTLAVDLDGGLEVWDRFDVTPSAVLRRYRCLLDAFTDRLGDHSLVLELDHSLRRIWP